MTSNAEENAGEGGSSVWEGEKAEEEGKPAAVRSKSSEDLCNEGDAVAESDSESVFGHFVRTTQLLNGAAQDNGGGGCGRSAAFSQEEEEEEAAPESGKNDVENCVAEGATRTEAVITTNGHSFSSCATMTHLNHDDPSPRDDSEDSTVSSSTASSSSSAYDACRDNNNFQPSTTSPDYMNLALKQWSVYLGNVLLNFIHKECKGDNRCDVQQQQQQQPAQQLRDHNQASTSAAAATAGYCPCCHYHNQMAQQQPQQPQQQQQQQQSPQQPQQNHLPPPPPQPASQSQQQTAPPPLHQGYYNYAANFSPFFSAAAAAAAFASSSSSSSSDPSQHFPHNNRTSPLFRGRGVGGCHYVRTNNVVSLARASTFIRPNCFPH